MLGACVGGLVLSCGACGSALRAKVTAPVAPSSALAAPTRLPVARAKETQPEVHEESGPGPDRVPDAPSTPNVDARPFGIVDCAGTETAELLVITSDEPNAPAPLEVPYGPDAPTTVYLSRSGCAVKRVPGVSVSAGGKVWQLQNKSLTVRTGACSVSEDEVRPAGEGSAERVELTAVGGRQVVVAPPRKVADNEYAETTHFVVAVGETLYFKNTTYASFCGAHGGTMTRFFAHDLLGRKGRYFSDGPSDEQQLLAEASKQWQSDLPSSSPFKFTTTLPYYADGALHFLAQLTAGSTYVESDGLTVSYERSVFLPTEWFGDGFAKFRQAPSALAAVVAQRNVRVFGWSEL